MAARIARSSSLVSRLLLMGASLLILTGCPQSSNKPPDAIAGDDQAVDVGAIVTLDGSASSDPDGDSITYSWKQTLGTPVSLSSTTDPIVTFTAPDKGTSLALELTVSDGKLSSSANTSVAVRLVDSSVDVEERIQRSVTDDPAVLGFFPNDWLIPDAGAGLPPPPTQEDPLLEDEPEFEEFVERFEDVHVPQVVQEDLGPGATRTITLDINAPSGLGGLAQWIGTTSPLEVTISLGDTKLVTGSTYSMGHDRGGSYLTAQTTAGGQARFSVKNTSDITVIVRMSFAARDIDSKPEPKDE